jgi:ribosomal protein L7/L12
MCCFRQNNFWVILKTEILKGKIEMIIILTICNYVIFGLLFVALACYSNTGTTIADETGKNIESLKAEAERGNAEAQLELGVCYFEGSGVKEDKAEAVKWYRKAAEQGLAEAQYNLGVCYQNGEGVEKDEAEAVKWLRKAAEQGLAEAQYYLGLCYDNGDGVEKDEAEAVKWYRKQRNRNWLKHSTISVFATITAKALKKTRQKP